MTPFFGFAAHLPFTLVLLSLIFGMGIWTQSCRHPLSEKALHHFGFAPQDFKSLAIMRLFSSVLITDKPSSWIQALGMVGVIVGGTEWVLGTRKALLSFWGIHILTVLLFYFAFTLPYKKIAAALIRTRDVGSSSGYFGCLGILAHRFPFPHRFIFRALILLGLILTVRKTAGKRPIAKVELSSDMAHVLSFTLGWLISFIL